MSDDDFLSRWSARKRRVASADARIEPAQIPLEPEPLEGDEESQEELLNRLDLPDPDTLGEGDDFTPFMKAGVPEFIRRKALRRLWRSNPVLANLDGLNDYDDDFNAPELTQKVLATAYKVGRGILREKPDEQVKADEDESVAEVEPGDEMPDGTDDVGEAVPQMQVENRPSEPLQSADDMPRPRRMRFET